jgi:fumarylacetoacetate (FAA) hydrolase
MRTMQEAIERWDAVQSKLVALPEGRAPLDPTTVLAPLPRAWQWLDGAAYR